MTEPIPTQYKRLTDECVNDIMDAAKRLYPIITELGNSITMTDGRIVVVVSRKEDIVIDGKRL